MGEAEACVGGDIFYQCCYKLHWSPREIDENHTIVNGLMDLNLYDMS